MWRKSRLKLNENKKNDLLWLILHRAVRVRYSLKAWGYKIQNDKCAICNRPETIEHCFLKCPRAVRVWNRLSPILSKFSSEPFSISVPSVYYPLSGTQSSPLLHYLIATALYWIWHARDLATFRKSCLTSVRIVDLIIKDVKIRIRCAARDAVRTLWSKDSILCSVDEKDNISFSI